MSREPKKLSVGFLFDDTLDSTDGVAQYVKTLGGWLSRQGHDVRYLVGETKIKQWSGGKVYSMSKNQTVVFNGNKLSMPLFAKKADITSVLKDSDFDVLHIMMPYSPLMSQRVMRAAGLDIALVGTFHIFPSGIMSKIGSRLLKIVYGRGLRRINPVVSVSSAAAGFANSAFGLQTAVVPNPVELSRFSGHEAASGPPTVVFLGRLVKRKGCAQLIDAFALLHKRLPRAVLVIAGDGPLRKKLERRAEQLGISSAVTFKGYIDESQKPALLAGADIACFPSLYGESFGIVLIEAMAAGAKVVLGGNNPGYSSVLGDQPKLLVNPTNIKEFAQRLESLLSNQAVAEGLHRWQRQEVAQYDIEVVGSQILDIYRTAIAHRLKTGNNGSHESKSDS